MKEGLYSIVFTTGTVGHNDTKKKSNVCLFDLLKYLVAVSQYYADFIKISLPPPTLNIG